MDLHRQMHGKAEAFAKMIHVCVDPRALFPGRAASWGGPQPCVSKLVGPSPKFESAFHRMVRSRPERAGTINPAADASHRAGPRVAHLPRLSSSPTTERSGRSTQEEGTNPSNLRVTTHSRRRPRVQGIGERGRKLTCFPPGVQEHNCTSTLVLPIACPGNHCYPFRESK